MNSLKLLPYVNVIMVLKFSFCSLKYWLNLIDGAMLVKVNKTGTFIKKEHVLNKLYSCDVTFAWINNCQTLSQG